ncbi:universal stress protein [Kriegella sp. EG-1]|nr:universal stress protein [Flavobacteriaceae bacterium EG-1]
MRNILLPTDFSENAFNAAKYATQLFNQEECDFYLLNTYTPSIVHSRFLADTKNKSVGHVNESRVSIAGLNKVIQQINSFKNNKYHNFRSISSFDFLTQKVLDTIKNEDIDIIVSGTKGASGYKEVFLGTNTVRMIKNVKNIPIIAVPEIYEFQNLNHIAFPTDFKHHFSAEIMHPLLSLAKKFNSKIHILHINESNKKDKFQESNKFTLMEYLSPVEHEFHYVPHYSAKTNVIANFLKELDINLLAMVYNERNYLDQLMREPVVTNMAYHCKIPLLVLPS